MARCAWARRLGVVGLGLLVAFSSLRFSLQVAAVHTGCCADFPVFEEAAEQWARGEPLYGRALHEYGPGSAVYKFPPLLALLLAAGQGLRGGRVQDAVFVLQVASYLVATALVLAMLARRGASRATRAVVLAVALNFGPFFETLFRLQLENPMLLCVAVAGFCLCVGRAATAGAALAVATVFKLYTLPLLAPLALMREKRGVAGFVVCLAGLGAISWVGVGPKDAARFATQIVPAMLQERSTEQFGAENVGVQRLLGRLAGLEADKARRTGSAFVAFACLVSAWALLRRSVVPALRDHVEALLLFIPLVLLALPNSWLNYQLLLLPPLALLIDAGARGRVVPLVSGAVAALVLCLSTYEAEWLGPELLRLESLHPLASQFWCDVRPLPTLLCWLGMLGLVWARPGCHVSGESRG